MGGGDRMAGGDSIGCGDFMGGGDSLGDGDPMRCIIDIATGRPHWPFYPRLGDCMARPPTTTHEWLKRAID